MMKPIVQIFVHDLQDARGDVPAFLDKVVGAGCHDLHFFAFRAAPGACKQGATTMPYNVVGKWTHPTSGETFPLYKLTKNWNKAYFKKLRLVLNELKKRDIRPWISIHDIRLRDKHGKYWHPFCCSEEALGPNTPGGVWGEPNKPWGMFQYHRNFIRLLAQRVDAVYDDPAWEMCNEFNTPPFQSDDYMVEAHGKLSDVLDAAGAGLTQKWTSGTTAAYRNVHEYSAHGVVRPEKVIPVPGIPHAATIISGDGGSDGDGRADKKGRKGASPAQAAAVVKRVKALKMVGYEVLDRGLWKSDNDLTYLDDFDPASLAAACKEANK
jgi:hypothetical protein